MREEDAGNMSHVTTRRVLAMRARYPPACDFPGRPWAHLNHSQTETCPVNNAMSDQSTYL